MNMMKRIGIIKYILAMLLVLLVSTGCQKKEQVVEKVEPKKETELLFSFDSYQEIVGTKIQLGSQFGATAINMDTMYLTEGKGSWLVKPQGNYENASVQPYFTFNCDDTTFKNADFMAFDKLMLDVYNDSDEEATIRWSFTMKDDLEGTSRTQLEEYTLTAKKWTTCEYNLTSEAYGTFFHPDEVVTMTVTFLDTKTSKDDAVKELYIDNLRGHYAESECEITGMEFDLSQGLTFESVTDQYVFSTSSLNINKCDLSRVAYADTSLENVEASFGEYCLKGNATGATWPAFTLKFDKAYAKEQLLSFWVYIEVDDEKAKDITWFPDSFISEGDRTKFSMMTGRSKFNRWVQVYGVLPAATSTTWTYFNLDQGTGKGSVYPFDEGVDVTIYMDNFQISEYEEYISVDGKGNVTATNPYNRTTTTYLVDKAAKKDDVFSFDIDFNMSDTVSVWILGDGGTDGWETEWYAKRYAKWEGPQTIAIKVPQDTENFKIVFSYGGESGDYRKNIATIKNIRVRKNCSVDNEGNVTLYNYVGGKTTQYTFKQPLKKGQIVSFDVDVTPSQSISVWLLGDKNWETEWYAKKYNEWTGKTNISVTLPADTNNFTVVVGFNDETKDPYKNVATITNMQTGSDRVVVKEDGTVLLQNHLSGGKTTRYTYDLAVKKGEIISFDVDVTPAQSISVWLLGTDMRVDGVWKNEWYAKKYDEWTGKTNISVTLPADTNNFTILVGYNDAEQNYKNNVVTISNMQTGSDRVVVKEDGTVLLQNHLSGVKTTKHTFDLVAKKGEYISFDVDVTPAQSISVWLLGTDMRVDPTWKNEWYAQRYDEWTGKTTIQVPMPSDVENFTIMVGYNDAEQDYKNNVVTISNVKVVRDRIEVNEDGSIVLQNDKSGKKTVQYTFEQSVEKNKTISFDVDVTPAQNISVWLLGDGMWSDEWYAKQYKVWTGKTTIAVTIPEDTSNFTIVVAYNDTNQDFKANEVTIFKPTVRKGDVVENADGSVTIYNTTDQSSVKHTFNRTAKKGQIITFKVDVSPAQKATVWFFGSKTLWTNEWFGKQYNTELTNQIIAVELAGDITDFTVLVRFDDTSKDRTQNVVNISEVAIRDSGVVSNADGSTTVYNGSGARNVLATIATGDYKVGDAIAFDIDFNMDEAVAIYVRGKDASGNNITGESMYAAAYTWNGKQTITTNAISVEGVKEIEVFIQYRKHGTQTGLADYKDNVAIISNVQTK